MLTRILSCVFIAFASLTAIAQTASLDPEVPNRSPFFARVGDTVFLSGHFLHWMADYEEALFPNSLDERQKLITNPIANIVFVNVVTTRPTKPWSGSDTAKLFKQRGINNAYVVGQCDLFCARMFANVQNRYLAQDDGERTSQVAFQVPYDIGENWESKTLDRGFPNIQIAPFEWESARFAKDNKDLLVKAFSKPLDGSGGLFVGHDKVEYCDSKLTGVCSILSGMTAFSMGLTTSPDRVSINLPIDFGYAQHSGFAKIEDVDALPLKDKAGAASDYRRFIEASKRTTRYFAVSLSGDSWGFARGSKTVEGNAVTRALNLCEKKSISGSKCKLYAVNDDVVW